MPSLILTPELIARIEQFHVAFGTARLNALSALPGNPYGAEVKYFGDAVALKFLSPLLRSKNRVGNFTQKDAECLPDILAYYTVAGIRPSLYVPYGQMNASLFRTLTDSGFWSGGSGTVPIRSSIAPLPVAPEGIDIMSDIVGKHRRFILRKMVWH